MKMNNELGRVIIDNRVDDVLGINYETRSDYIKLLELMIERIEMLDEQN